MGWREALKSEVDEARKKIDGSTGNEVDSVLEKGSWRGVITGDLVQKYIWAVMRSETRKCVSS